MRKEIEGDLSSVEMITHHGHQEKTAKEEREEELTKARRGMLMARQFDARVRSGEVAFEDVDEQDERSRRIQEHTGKIPRLNSGELRKHYSRPRPPMGPWPPIASAPVLQDNENHAVNGAVSRVVVPTSPSATIRVPQPRKKWIRRFAES